MKMLLGAFRRAVLLVPVLLAGWVSSNASEITVLSSRADMVSGGDALVSVRPLTPSGDPATPANARVTLNAADVTASFSITSEGKLLGRVTGLVDGNNRLQVFGSGLRPADLTLTNFPITGPIFSGKQETPFYCMTTNFRLLASLPTLGAPLDANCSVVTRVEYVYRTTANTFAAFPTGARPTDIAQVTTSTGKTVPYIVRVETGTINRAMYETAVLSDPATEPAPSFRTPPVAWNQRLVFTFGGGCTGGWYIQGAGLGDPNILEDQMLRKGYAVASSSLNVFGNNCNHVLSAETAMMVKERFIETYGPPVVTMGFGCSGGSEQQHPISDGYPGILDGIIVGCSFPDVTAGMIINLTDADLWLHYVSSRTAAWSDSAQLAVTGYQNTNIPPVLSNFASRVKTVPGQCNAAIPAATRYDPVTNPGGVRCDIYDHNINIFSADPNTGFARRPLDNVGIQYGLNALNAGQITKAQFIDLNRNVGGYDNDGKFVATRTVADPVALDLAYRTGQVTYGGNGMRHTPIIDYRGYVDLPADVHQFFHSHSMRERLRAVNGSLENHVMLVNSATAAEGGHFNHNNVVLAHTVDQMDQWVTNLLNIAPRGMATLAQIGQARPADLTDACFTNLSTTKIIETQVYRGTPPATIYTERRRRRGWRRVGLWRITFSSAS
jgi:hypothetical protein